MTIFLENKWKSNHGKDCELTSLAYILSNVKKKNHYTPLLHKSILLIIP